MPVKDQVTGQEVNLADVATIASNTTTVGEIIDTANFDMGVYFSLFCTAYTDGTYTLTIEEGDDAALADATTVSSDQLIGSLASVSAATTHGTGVLPSTGVHSTKRYVRPSIVSTGVTTGATVGIVCVKGKEVS